MKTYNLSKYPVHRGYEAYISYSVIYPNSDQSDAELSALFNVPRYLNAMAKSLSEEQVPENVAFVWYAEVVQVGRNPSGDHICLVLRAMYHYDEDRFEGGYFIVVCDELGKLELYQDRKSDRLPRLKRMRSCSPKHGLFL